MKAYIRSYFDGDFEKFKKRFGLVSSFLKIAEKFNVPVTFVAQKWTDSVKNLVLSAFPNTTLDIQNEPLGDAGSFNYILKNYLYNTDEDYIIHLDDDIIVFNEYYFGQVLDYFNTHANKIKGHFNGLIYSMKGEVPKRFPKREIKITLDTQKYPWRSQICVLWNTKKHLNKEIYSNDFLKSLNTYVADDFYFATKCRLNDVPFYNMNLLKFSQDGWNDDKSTNYCMPKGYSKNKKEILKIAMYEIEKRTY